MNRDQPLIPLPLDSCLKTLPLGLGRKNLLRPSLPTFMNSNPNLTRLNLLEPLLFRKTGSWETRSLHTDGRHYILKGSGQAEEEMHW